MLVLNEGNEIWQLWNSVNLQRRSVWLCICTCIRPYLYWLDVILLTAVWGGGIKYYALLGEHYIILVQQSCWVLYQLEPSDVLLTCTWAVGHYLTFPSPGDVWRHWRHSRSQISHEPSDIIFNLYVSRRTLFLSCTWVCMGLDGSTCSELFPVGTCHFEPPEQPCAVMSGRAPCVPLSREHEERPATGREKMSKCQKNTFVHSILAWATRTTNLRNTLRTVSLRI